MPQVLVFLVDTTAFRIMECLGESVNDLCIVAPNPHTTALSKGESQGADGSEDFCPAAGLPPPWDNSLCDRPPCICVGGICRNEAPSCNSGVRTCRTDARAIDKQVPGLERGHIK